MRGYLKVLSVLVVVVALVSVSFGQMRTPSSTKQSSGSVPIGFGATFVNGQTFYLVNIAPEVAFGKLGIGLDINLRFTQEGKFHSVEYKKFGDFLRMIRYVRWAQKGDPFYVRFGQLDYSVLGHGLIMYNYRNTASYDLRKTGIELDVDFEKFGFESMYSDFAGRGILGLRGYVRPMKYTSIASMPVIGGLETGLTFASDMNADADRQWSPTSTKEGGSMSIVGFDLGLPIISATVIRSTLYFDYAKIMGYGSGAAAGIDFRFNGMGAIALAMKYERRFIGDQFIPSYFDALYEKERFVRFDTTQFASKAMALQNARKSEGYYGEIMLSVLNTINIIGGYQAPVGVKNAGTLHLELETGNVIPSIVVGAGYDKKNVGRVFVNDENSLMYAQVGYKPMPYLLVSTAYIWTWTARADGNGYESQRRIEPKVSLVFNF